MEGGGIVMSFKSREQEINYIGNHLASLCPVSFGEYSRSGKLKKQFWVSREITVNWNKYIREAIEGIDERRVKRLCIDDLEINFWVYLSDDERYFVWGPAKERDINAVLAVISSFAYALDKRVFTFSDMEYYPKSVKENVRMSNQITDYMLYQEDAELENHTYSEEQFPLELLSQGDEEGMHRYIHLHDIQYPNVMPMNSKKNEEYMAVSAVSIMARTAIESGVTSVESFRLSDIFLKRIARLNDVKSIRKEREQALLAFTRLVKENKDQERKNAYVTDCKNAIAAHIFEKISLNDIAQKLGVRETYLARLFTQEEGISVGQYIRKEKIKLAKNMLRYSDRSIVEISDYLGFNSQSYFGKIFKDETGLTPEVYRRKYKIPEF